jgi:hypothetical protein
MADYRLPDGCFPGHRVNRAECVMHEHDPHFAPHCVKCADMVTDHQHDALRADRCARCRQLAR